MTSQVTIGRVGLDIDTGELNRWEQSGDTVNTGGVFPVASVAAAKAMRQQLLGLDSNPDEPIVPVVWADDPASNGYYRVLDMVVVTDAMTLTYGLLSWKAKLQFFSYYPQIEMVLRSVVRQGKPGGITAKGFHATPSTWLGVDYGQASETFDTRNLTASVKMNVLQSTSTSVLALATAGVDPADYYTGSAYIKTGSGPYYVVGRQPAASPTAWELGNGLIKISNSTGSGNHFSLSFTDTSGTSAYGGYGYVIGYNALGTPTMLPGGVTPRSMKVLRNSPEECVIRLTYPVGATSTKTDSLTCDISLRRGARYATITIRSSESTTWGIYHQTVTAYTSVTAGYTARTTANTNGSRLILGSQYSSTVDLTNGGIFRSSGTNGTSVWIGVESGGSGSVAPDTVTEQEANYWFALTEAQRVVAQRVVAQ